MILIRLDTLESLPHSRAVRVGSPNRLSRVAASPVIVIAVGIMFVLAILAIIADVLVSVTAYLGERGIELIDWFEEGF